LTDESGKDIEAENSFHINEDGTVDNCYNRQGYKIVE